MKRIIILLLLFTFCTDLFSQQRTEPYRKITKADYLRKSRNRNIIGWVMVGCGVVCLIAPTPPPPNADVGNSLLDLPHSFVKTANTISYITGALIIGGSVPLFISAHNNKKNAGAMAIMIKTESMPGFAQNGFPIKAFPSAGIRIVFR